MVVLLQQTFDSINVCSSLVPVACGVLLPPCLKIKKRILIKLSHKMIFEDKHVLSPAHREVRHICLLSTIKPSAAKTEYSDKRREI